MKTIILLAATCWAINLNAQQAKPQVIATCGNTNQINNTIISYTVGETVVNTFSNNNTILTQGYQQPHYNITQIKPTTSNNLNINIYPNPAEDLLNINFNNSQPLNIDIKIYDITGKLIISHIQLINEKHLLSLPMKNVAAGKYLLNIYCKEINEQFSFEVIKH
jgi:hypothetical protein